VTVACDGFWPSQFLRGFLAFSVPLQRKDLKKFTVPLRESVKRFSTSGFFMNHCPPGPQVFHWDRFEFVRKFAEIFANQCLSAVSTTPAISCSPVSTTSANNPCHGFSVIAGVVDTGDKFLTGVNKIRKKIIYFSLLSPVSLTPLINIHSQIFLRIFEKI
jgi:hypothetical protein